jgi:hypothetical protein
LGADEILGILLQKISDIKILKRALDRAINEDQDRCAAVIVGHFPDSAALRDMFHFAVQRGLVLCVTAMLKKGVNPNLPGDVSIHILYALFISFENANGSLSKLPSP